MPVFRISALSPSGARPPPRALLEWWGEGGAPPAANAPPSTLPEGTSATPIPPPPAFLTAGDCPPTDFTARPKRFVTALGLPPEPPPLQANPCPPPPPPARLSPPHSSTSLSSSKGPARRLLEGVYPPCTPRPCAGGGEARGSGRTVVPLQGTTTGPLSFGGRRSGAAVLLLLSGRGPARQAFEKDPLDPSQRPAGPWTGFGTALPRDASEGTGPQRRLGRRLEEGAEAVGGGYCRLQMALRPALGVRETVAGHRLGALEGGGGGYLHPLPMHPWPCLPHHLIPHRVRVVAQVPAPQRVRPSVGVCGRAWHAVQWLPRQTWGPLQDTAVGYCGGPVVRGVQDGLGGPQDGRRGGIDIASCGGE